MQSEVAARIADAVSTYEPELVELRRDVHAHPELSWNEHRTTALVSERLEKAGWTVTHPGSTGLIADLGATAAGPRVALRADLDALPVEDITTDPWRSTITGVAHACGHDVHTVAVLGAGLALADLHKQAPLPGRVRLVFQPAEEVMPGGALTMMSHGVLDGVDRIFAMHCDPVIDAGQVGLRPGPITSATDMLTVHLTGPGGHTSRPHLTGDLTYALAVLTTQLPAVLSRRMDPRSGVSVVWGALQAGQAANVIPRTGSAAGTIRILDAEAWIDCETVVRRVVEELVAPYGITATIDYQRGVPPVVNDVESHRILTEAVRVMLGERGQTATPQSLGGEDFGWYLEQVPGAMLRLGVRTPGGPTQELHKGDLRVDERALGVGASVLAAAAVRALTQPA